MAVAVTAVVARRGGCSCVASVTTVVVSVGMVIWLLSLWLCGCGVGCVCVYRQLLCAQCNGSC